MIFRTQTYQDWSRSIRMFGNEAFIEILSFYATSPLEKMDKSISFYWKNMAQGDKHEKAFSEVAKKWLTPPPSSVDVERLFSTAGNVTPDKRKAILPLTVLKVFKFPYHPGIFRAYRDQIMDCS